MLKLCHLILAKTQQGVIFHEGLKNASSISLITRGNSSLQNPTSLPVDLDKVREEFQTYEGGQITLNKDEESGIAFICLDHVGKKNSISGKMMVELNEAVSSLENWSTGKAVILHSKGDTFSSGGYLKTFKLLLSPEAGLKLTSLMHDSTSRLLQLPLISVSVVHGKAIGGGAELTLATDFRLFTPTGNISFIEAKMGHGVGAGGGTSLRRLIGRSKALDLLLTCREVKGEEAIKIGLADEMILGDNPLKEAVDWVKTRISNYDPCVVQTVKQIIACNSYESERQIFASTWSGKAHRKAMDRNIKHK